MQLRHMLVRVMGVGGGLLKMPKCLGLNCGVHDTHGGFIMTRAHGCGVARVDDAQISFWVVFGSDQHGR